MNYTPCLIAFVFISGILYLNLISDKQSVISDFRNSLPTELKQKYENIANERRNIYVSGVIYGFMISLALLLVIPKNKKSNKICLSLAVTLIFSYIYYIVYPKSDHIILYLDEQKDREKWLKVYKHMQLNYHTGIIVGLLIVSILWFVM